jgi:hypothetical protein
MREENKALVDNQRPNYLALGEQGFSWNAVSGRCSAADVVDGLKFATATPASDGFGTHADNLGCLFWRKGIADAVALRRQARRRFGVGPNSGWRFMLAHL